MDSKVSDLDTNKLELLWVIANKYKVLVICSLWLLNQLTFIQKNEKAWNTPCTELYRLCTFVCGKMWCACNMGFLKKCNAWKCQYPSVKLFSNYNISILTLWVVIKKLIVPVLKALCNQTLPITPKKSLDKFTGWIW